MKKLIILLAFIPALAWADTTIVTSTKAVSPTVTVQAAAYHTGDNLTSGLVEIVKPGRTAVGSGVIQAITVQDIDAQAADIDVVIFDSNCSVGVGSVNAAFTPPDSCIPKIIGVVPIRTHYAFADNGVSIATNVGLPFALTTPTASLYAALVVRGAPTYTATSSLTMDFLILQD